MSNKNNRSKRWRQFRVMLFLLAGYSLVQYIDTGTVSWPETVFHKVTKNLHDYATSPDASWRQAAEKLEKIGKAREGEPIPDFNLTGRVVRIADGDTVSILDSTNTQYKIRLFGIDTPERNQPYGAAAKSALARLVEDKTVGIVVVETDSYGRKVGTLYLDGININLAMVVGGHAWWYQDYARNERKLAVSEQEARRQKLGLWAEPDPIPPWKWRRGQRP